MTPHEFQGLDFARAIDDLAAPAYMIDREGRFSWVNQAYIELLGDQRGRPFSDSVAPEHRQRARTNFARKVVGKTTTVFDLTVLDRDGQRITVRVTSAPMRKDGEIIGIFGIGIPLPQVPVPSRSVLDDLTPRQQEVLWLLAEGLETPEIAKRLGVAEETARNHIRALLRATGAHSRLEAVLMGMRLGVVAPDLMYQSHDEPGSDADH